MQRRIEPGAGQESVWDYPRPPRIEATDRHIQVIVNGVVIADTRRAVRVLETSHPPVYYIPPEDVQMQYLSAGHESSVCEWKGQAGYYNLSVDGKTIPQAAWYYARPTPEFASIAGYVAFYPGKMDACLVDDERVQAQPGDFYGGWITADIVGPFKGDPGTRGW